jgi:rhamnose utilization protein RhaD (predicted bifunctional aldolase and dehydrogenase)
MVSTQKKRAVGPLIKELIAMSRLYGADPTHVIAGGGNTSVKNGNSLWIKASGKAMATIGPDPLSERLEQKPG